MIINNIKTPRAIETSRKPIAHPARKATLNPSFNEETQPAAVLELELVAIIMQAYPEAMDVTTPTIKAAVV